MPVDNQQLATGMMQLAVKRMVAKFPFHTGVVCAGRLEEESAVETMAVTVRDGRLCFLFAADFVVCCSYDELISVLCHEVNHVIFGHLTMSAEQFPDSDALAIAQEVTVNEWISGPLPGDPITLDQYPGLPPDESTVERYRRLSTRRKRRRAGQNSSGSGRKTGPSAQKSGPNGPKTGPNGQKNGPTSPDSGPPGQPRRTTDDHSVWAELSAQKQVTELAIKHAVARASEQLTPADRKKVPAAIRQQIKRINGSEPGATIETVDADAHRQLQWTTILRRYLGQANCIEASFARPPRRCPELIGIMPALTRRREKPRIMAVIDTSGSITSEMLEQISGELLSLGRRYDVHIVECDAEIHADYPLAGPIQSVHGRGGTDFRPPFERSVLRRIKPDVIVYFTDGFGPAPMRRPAVPTIWCLTHDGEKPASWGRSVRMEVRSDY